MYTDESQQASDGKEAVDAADESKERALSWLLDMDLSDAKESLFAIERKPEAEAELTESELAVARRPMIRGSAGADNLESYVDEEIVMSSDTQGSDIYAADSTIADSVTSAEQVFSDEHMSIDHSRDATPSSARTENGVSEGADILGLADDDEMGEAYFVIKRVKKESGNTQQQVLAGTTPADADSGEHDDSKSSMAVQDEKLTESLPLVMDAVIDTAMDEGLHDALALKLVTPEQPESLDLEAPIDSADVPGNVFGDGPEEELTAAMDGVPDDLVASASAEDTLEFDEYLLDGKSLADDEIEFEELSVVAIDGDEEDDFGFDELSDYGGGLQQLTAADNSIAADLALLLPKLNDELAIVLNERLATLGLASGTVLKELMLADGDCSVEQLVADNFAPVIALCSTPLVLLQGLRQVEVDSIYLRLLYEPTGQYCNQLFEEEFTLSALHDPGVERDTLEMGLERTDISADTADSPETSGAVQQHEETPEIGCAAAHSDEEPEQGDPGSWLAAVAQREFGVSSGATQDSPGVTSPLSSDVQEEPETSATSAFEPDEEVQASSWLSAKLQEDADSSASPSVGFTQELEDNVCLPAESVAELHEGSQSTAEFPQDIDSRSWPSSDADGADILADFGEPVSANKTGEAIDEVAQESVTGAGQAGPLDIFSEDLFFDDQSFGEDFASSTLSDRGAGVDPEADIDALFASLDILPADSGEGFVLDERTPPSGGSHLQLVSEADLPEMAGFDLLSEPEQEPLQVLQPESQPTVQAEQQPGWEPESEHLEELASEPEPETMQALESELQPEPVQELESEPQLEPVQELESELQPVPLQVLEADPQPETMQALEPEPEPEPELQSMAQQDEQIEPQTDVERAAASDLPTDIELEEPTEQEPLPANVSEFSFIPTDIRFAQASPGGGEIFADFLDAFIEEGSSELEKLEDAVAQWEKEVDSDAAFVVVGRTLHTLKGIAKGVGLQFYGTLIHNFETLLSALPGPQAGAEGDYFRMVNGWLDACVRGLDQIQDTRADITYELPQLASRLQPAAEPVFIETVQPAETTEEVLGTEPASEQAQTELVPVLSPTSQESERRANKQSNKIADDGARVLAAQQSVRITSEKLDHLLNLSNQAQQLSVRTAQSVTRSKRASNEMQSRLASVRAHIAAIADRALRSVAAQGVQPGAPLDALEMDQYSELQEAANILREGVEDLSDLVDFATRQNTQVEALLKQQTKVISSIGTSIRGARVVPVSRLMPGLRRLVRTVSVDLDKTVSFRVLSELGTLDRDDYARCQTILDHMVRNALDHGIEHADERLAAGKPAGGLVTIDISKAGADAIVTLSDDGRGIDPQKMRDSAIQKGLDIDVEALSDAEAARLIFHKGFSTANSISQISGRGVGMDIVLSELQEMGGDIQIDSVPGRGTSFSIRVPSSVTVNGALLVSAGEQSYAIPLGGLVAVEQVPVQEFFCAVQNKTSLSLAGFECEPAYLATLCQSGHSLDAKTWQNNVPVIIAGSPERYMAIAIDDVEEALELVIRSLGTQFSAVPGVAGAATTAAGEAIVALDLNLLVASVGAEDQSSLHVDTARDEGLLVMVVDDSRTQRMVATSQLDTVGVRTITAENGAVAIDLLNTAERLPDIILMDVEMPVKDGIQALREIRKSVRYSSIPVIMITSRTGLKHRAMAQAAGCNGYMGKPFNFRMLIGQINQLTGQRLQLS